MKVISRNANVLGDLKKSRDLKDAILHHKLDIIFIQEIKKIKIHQLGWKQQNLYFQQTKYSKGGLCIIWWKYLGGIILKKLLRDSTTLEKY